MSQAASSLPAGRRLLGRGSIYTLGTASRLAGTLLAIPVVTRFLGSEDYGTVALAIAIQLVVGGIATFGLPNAILRLYFDHDESEDGVAMGRGLIVSTGFSAAAVVGLVMLSAIAWAPALAPGDSEALLIGVGLALPGAMMGSCMYLLRAQERPGAFIVLTLTFSLGAQLLGIVGLSLDPQPWTYLTGVALAYVIGAVVGLRLTGALGPPAPWPVLRSALHYGIPTIPMMVSSFILAAGDRFVIQVVSGLSAVGKYQIAYAFGSLGGTLLTSLRSAWLPITFAASEDERWTSLADTAAMITRLAALFCAFLALIADVVLPIIVPADYSPRLLAEVTAIVALSSLPLVAYTSQSQVLLWHKHTRPLAWIAPTAAAFNLTLVAVLLPPFGLRGAAAATVIAVVAEAVLTGWAARRLTEVPWRRRADALSYAIAVPLVALALLLPHTALGTIIRLGVSTLVASAFLARVVAELRSKPAPPQALPSEPEAAPPAAVA